MDETIRFALQLTAVARPFPTARRSWLNTCSTNPYVRQAFFLSKRKVEGKQEAHLGLHDPRHIPEPECVRDTERTHREHRHESPRRRTRRKSVFARVRRDVDEQEGEREERHAEDHAEQGPEQQDAATDAVDQAQRDECRDEVRDGDEDRKGRWLAETRLVDDLGGAAD